MTVARLLITGKMGSGKSSASAYLCAHHRATRWTRSESMKRLAHALVEQVGDAEALLRALVPDEQMRDIARAELLRYIAGYTPETGKARRLYQDVAQILIDLDPLVFEEELMRRIAASEAAEPKAAHFSVIDDVRSRAAYDFFADRGYRTLRIEADESVRKARMLARDGYLPSESTFRHPSETELDGVPHEFVITNNAPDMSGLTAQLDALVEALGVGKVRA